jgi:hypothetical protein
MSLKKRVGARYSSTVPHSNDELRRLLPPALQAIENDQGSRWNDLSDFPDAVQEWFRGQKEILSYARCIHGMSDIAGIFKASCMPTNTELASFSLKEMFRIMMSKQILALGKANGKDQDLYHIRFDSQSIETCCHQCNSGLDDDHDLRWSTKRPGFYIARQGACRRFNGNLRTRKPVNASIAWIHGRLEHLQREVSPEELQNPGFMRNQRSALLLPVFLLGTATIALFWFVSGCVLNRYVRCFFYYSCSAFSTSTS